MSAPKCRQSCRGVLSFGQEKQKQNCSQFSTKRWIETASSVSTSVWIKILSELHQCAGLFYFLHRLFFPPFAQEEEMSLADRRWHLVWEEQAVERGWQNRVRWSYNLNRQKHAAIPHTVQWWVRNYPKKCDLRSHGLQTPLLGTKGKNSPPKKKNRLGGLWINVIGFGTEPQCQNQLSNCIMTENQKHMGCWNHDRAVAQQAVGLRCVSCLQP